MGSSHTDFLRMRKIPEICFSKNKNINEIVHVWALLPVGGAHKKKNILNTSPLQGKEKIADQRQKAS